MVLVVVVVVVVMVVEVVVVVEVYATESFYYQEFASSDMSFKEGGSGLRGLKGTSVE